MRCFARTNMHALLLCASICCYMWSEHQYTCAPVEVCCYALFALLCTTLLSVVVVVVLLLLLIVVQGNVNRRIMRGSWLDTGFPICFARFSISSKAVKTVCYLYRLSDTCVDKRILQCVCSNKCNVWCFNYTSCTCTQPAWGSQSIAHKPLLVSCCK